MRYRLICTSRWNSEDVLSKYPVVHNYNPVIDYPYPNPVVPRLTIEVPDLIKFYDDIETEIIIGKDTNGSNADLYYLEIYDDYRE